MSVTNLDLDSENRILKISLRVFPDDFGLALRNAYPLASPMETNPSSEKSKDLTLNYIKDKLAFVVNGRTLQDQVWTFLGQSGTGENLVYSFRITQIPLKIKTIQVQNSLMIETFRDQKNLVFFSNNGEEKGFEFDSGNTTQTVFNPKH